MNKSRELILEISSKLNKQQILQHNIAGLLYSSNPSKYEEYKINWATNFQSNELKFNEIKKISNLLGLKAENFTLLKGLALIDCLYENRGERFMSDSDLFCKREDLTELLNILESLNYEEYSETKWKGNEFKKIYFSKENKNVIEIHIDKIQFYEINFDWLKDKKLEFLGFTKLKAEYQLLHLISHLAIQHTFDSLTQFFDICLFIEKYNKNIDFELLEVLSKRLGCNKALKIILATVDNLLELDLGVNPKYAITIEQFLSYSSSPSKRYIMKHSIRDSFWSAVKYDLQWLISKIYGR